MADVAMDQPFTRPSCWPDHVVALSRSYVHRVGFEALIRRHQSSVASDDSERTAVNVHRVDEDVVATDEAKPDRLSDLHVNGIGSRVRLAIDGEIVREGTFHRHRRIREP